MIRILHVVTIMNRGGLETMIMNYYRKLDRSKVQFDFLVHRTEEGAYDQEIKKLGGIIHVVSPIRPHTYPKYFRELKKFFSEHPEYKIIHSHINENSGFVLREAKKAGVPIRIAHNHVANVTFDYKWPFRQYARYALRNAPTIRIACGEEAGEWLYKNKNFEVIQNAIDTEVFDFKEEVRLCKRKEFKLENKDVIGHVGRFHESKNHKFLIELFDEVQKKNENAVLVLVGEGPEKEKTEKLVKQLGIANKVVFLGLRTDVDDIFQVFDVFVFPSIFEALPLVLIEAQSTGVDCVVSTGIPQEANLTGIVEFIDLNESAKIWSERINKKLCEKSKRISRKEILDIQGYSVHKNLEKLLSYYKIED